jgi:hypothetical protein
MAKNTSCSSKSLYQKVTPQAQKSWFKYFLGSKREAQLLLEIWTLFGIKSPFKWPNILKKSILGQNFSKNTHSVTKI